MMRVFESTIFLILCLLFAFIGLRGVEAGHSLSDIQSFSTKAQDQVNKIPVISDVCSAISTFEDGLFPTSELHVATTGNDITGNGSPGNPYASIEGAAGSAVPGMAIVVHEGTYAGGQYVANLTGLESAPIWIGGAAGEARPVITGGTNGIQFSRARYVIVHDLEVTDASANGINCDDGGDYANDQAAHHIVFRDLYIHNIGGTGNQDCLKLSGLNEYFVLDSELSFCGGGGSGSGIDHVGCHHGLIARNYLHDNAGNAVQTKGGSEDIEIRWNRITDGGERALNMGGSTGFTYFRPPLSDSLPNAEARDIRAVANLIEGATTPIAFVGCIDCLAVNNTIIDPDRWLLRILQDTTTTPPYNFEACGGNTVVNNIFYYDKSALSSETVNIGQGTAPETFTFTTNLWYAHNNPSQSQPVLPVVETGGIYGEDPLFTTGYQIDVDGPAAREGTTVSGVDGDLIGQCYTDPPSIGVYEIYYQVCLPLISR
jgi:hypothetical protein